MSLGPVIVSTAVVGIVTIIVGLAMGWLQRLVGRFASGITGAFRADHRTISSGWFGIDQGAQSAFLVTIKCAPSKLLRKPVVLDHGQVARWVQTAFGDTFPSTPDYLVPTEQIRYRSCGGVIDPPAVAIGWPSGLLEARVPIPHGVDDSGQPVLALTAIMRPLIPVIHAIQNGAYSGIFGGSAFGQRKLDWHISLSRAVSNEAWTPWAGLVFPWQAPRGRATGMQPPMPTPGLGQRSLQSVRQRATADQILMPAFRDLLERSGYFDFNEALADIRTAISRQTEFYSDDDHRPS